MRYFNKIVFRFLQIPRKSLNNRENERTTDKINFQHTYHEQTVSLKCKDLQKNCYRLIKMEKSIENFGLCS